MMKSPGRFTTITILVLTLGLCSSAAFADRYFEFLDFESELIGTHPGDFGRVVIFGSPQGIGNPTDDCRDVTAIADGRGITSNGPTTDCSNRFGALIVDASQASRNGIVNLQFAPDALPDLVYFEVYQGAPGAGPEAGVEQVAVRGYDVSGVLFETQTSLDGVAPHSLANTAGITKIEIECNDGFTVDNIMFAGELDDDSDSDDSDSDDSDSASDDSDDSDDSEDSASDSDSD